MTKAEIIKAFNDQVPVKHSTRVSLDMVEFEYSRIKRLAWDIDDNGNRKMIAVLKDKHANSTVEAPIGEVRLA